MITRKEQILLHLYGQKGSGSVFQGHYEETQDGISEAIGISRSHVSIEINKLERMGLVEHSKKHVYVEGHRTNRRNCYRLNGCGLNEVEYMLVHQAVA